MTILRKIRLDLATPTEVALRAALRAVEAMPADVRLTEACVHVSAALDIVSRYVDEQMVNAGLDDGTSLADTRVVRDRWRADFEKKQRAYAAVYEELEDLKQSIVAK